MKKWFASYEINRLIKIIAKTFYIIDLDDDTLTGQLFMFIIAGMETTSCTIGFCLYELAKNPKIQEILRSEIRNVVKENNDQLNYDSLKDFSNLTKFINGLHSFYTFSYFLIYKKQTYW